MAVNEKAVYATAYTTHAGRMYRPGERIDDRMPAHAIQGAVEQGLTTASHAEAERAKGAESERQRQVQQQILTRSEKRDTEKRVDQRHN